MKEIKKISLRILFLIGSPKIGIKAEELMKNENVPSQYHIHAKGTASGEFADIIGLGGIDKTVIASILPSPDADKLLKKLRNRLYLGTPNTGVAFTVPLSGASGSVIKAFASYDENQTTETKKGDDMENKYSMIMAFVNQGFSEEVMAAAKPAGAGGGTVFHSRHVENENIVRIYGISVQPEREIVLILSEGSKKKDIMKAICEKCGASSEANGMVISVPVDSVEGLDKD